MPPIGGFAVFGNPRRPRVSSAELPADHIESDEAERRNSWGASGSRFDRVVFSGSTYSTPGWRRAQSQGRDGEPSRAPPSAGPRGPKVLAGHAVTLESDASQFRAGARVFHVKFGPGSVFAVDGNKLTVDFDKAGRKMVLDSFVSALTPRAGD